MDTNRIVAVGAYILVYAKEARISGEVLAKVAE